VRCAALRTAIFALAALLAAAAGCHRDDPERLSPAAPATLRGTIVMEPSHIGIGETAHIEVAVITPPDHRVAPVSTPEQVEGFWILGAEARRIDRSATRWVHRTRFKIRARETGSFTWPGQRIEVVAADGSRTHVAIEDRPLVVEAVSKEFPDREIFFPLRTPKPEPWSRGVLLPGAVGALFALAGVGLVALVRRVRSSRAQATTRAYSTGAGQPWRVAQAALATACELVESDPRRASDLASGALRLYLARRFHTPANARTTEELAAGEAPSALAGHWGALLALLYRIDALRFGPQAGGEENQELVAAAIREAQALVEAWAPRGSAP
jgi:hypothetical protein